MSLLFTVVVLVIVVVSSFPLLKGTSSSSQVRGCPLVVSEQMSTEKNRVLKLMFCMFLCPCSCVWMQHVTTSCKGHGTTSCVRPCLLPCLRLGLFLTIVNATLAGSQTSRGLDHLSPFKSSGTTDAHHHIWLTWHLGA